MHQQSACMQRAKGLFPNFLNVNIFVVITEQCDTDFDRVQKSDEQRSINC